MKLLYVAAAFLLACFALSVLAQTDSTRRIDQRQANQERRIEQGAKQGQQKMEDRAAADGKVTKKERARIEKAQDRQSRAIARERHDKQHAK
jgi:hypothetical protein